MCLPTFGLSFCEITHRQPMIFPLLNPDPKAAVQVKFLLVSRNTFSVIFILLIVSFYVVSVFMGFGENFGTGWDKTYSQFPY